MFSSASVKVIYDKASQKLKLRVIFNRTPHVYSANSDVVLSPEEWNKNGKARAEAMKSIADARDKATAICKSLDKDFTFEEFHKQYRIALYGDKKDPTTLQEVFKLYRLNHSLAIKTLDSYQTAVNWATRYRPNLKIADITKELVAGLVAYIRTNGGKDGEEATVNTIRIHIRGLKAIYNYAVEIGLTPDKAPFKGVSLTPVRSQNLGLTEEGLHKIVDYKPQNISEELGRDFFLLSFYCNGHYISDIVSLKNENFSGNTLTFVRKKTKNSGKVIKAILPDEAVALFNKYGNLNPSAPQDYVLPFLAGNLTEKQKEFRIRAVITKVNEGLTSMCKQLDMPALTSRQARHTFGSIAEAEGLTPREIQDAFGHTEINTTIGYLNSLSGKSLNKGKEIKEKFTVSSQEPKEQKEEKEQTGDTSSLPIVNELKELAKLHELGILTDEEFSIAKQKILSKL